MPRIAGVNIPEDKQTKISLTYIFGIGDSLSEEILERTGIEPQKQVSDLESDQLEQLRKIIEQDYQVEGQVRKEQKQAIRRLKDIKCWRGIRHIKGLPVRGQTTRVNSRTVRGNKRVTVGSGKKPPPAPK